MSMKESTYGFKRLFIGLIVFDLCMSATTSLIMIYLYRSQILSDVALQWFILQTFIVFLIIYFIMGIPFVIGIEMHARRGKKGFQMIMGITLAILVIAYAMYAVTAN